jgi:ERCC4-related helicase
VGITKYQAKYFAHELTKQCSSDSIQKLATALVDAQVDLNPHQVEAALFAFRSPLSKGALLADEVGLGKTIEAGLLISQKWAERKRKILIICPSNLRKQWNQELEDKFFLPSIILESKSLKTELKNGNLNPFEQKNAIVICSYEFSRNQAHYIQHTHWDLIVIDEAHRLRNVYKPQNKIANAIKEATASHPKVLLTATPFQNSLLELYGLVSIVDEHVFGDFKSFKSQFIRLNNEGVFDELKSRLKPVCKRTLRKQVLEYIKYTNRMALVQEFTPNPQEHELYEKVSNYLQYDQLYALPESQRKLMTLILRKLLASSTYAISGTLEALVKKLKAIVAKQEQLSMNASIPIELIEAEISENFETFDELKDEWTDEEDETSKEETIYSEQDLNNIKSEIALLEGFHRLAKSIKKNSKGEVLLTALKKGFEAAEKNGAKRKAIIFTESTRTQSYILEILESIPAFKDKIVLFNGSNNDPKSKQIYQAWLKKHEGSDRITGSKTADMRAALVDYFRDEAEIMIATEAAAEGINLQFCSMLINYDLPWNPQRIEQRIGRCHRYGQKFDVVVVNFLNKKNAADQRVYELLSEKFQLFDGVFGASDEILGAIESGVDFERRIAEIYHKSRTEAEIQDAFDELQKEFEPQIDEEMTRTKQKLLENFDAEVHEKLKISLEESKLYLNKYERWLWDVTKYYLGDSADFIKDNDDTYYFTLRSNPFPDEKIHPGPYRIGKKIEDANVYRIGHPLAQKIIEVCKQLELETVEIVFNLTGSGIKINILESLVGSNGYLEMYKMTISTFDEEDFILGVGIDDKGDELELEQIRWLLTLPANIETNSVQINNETQSTLDQQKEKLSGVVLNDSQERNARFFDDEMDRLDKWAADLKASLETQLRDIDMEIKIKKGEAKKITKLEEKLKAQKEIKKLEKKRNEMRLNLFQTQDDVDKQKDDLISNTEAKLKQRTSYESLFLVKWRLE